MVYGGHSVKKQKCIFIIFSLLCYDGCGGDQYTSLKCMKLQFRNLCVYSHFPHFVPLAD